MRVAVAVLLCAAAIVALPGNGYAHVRSHMDADDTAGPLDVRKVSLDRDGRDLVATVTTHDRLRKRHFTPGNAFFMEFDTRGGKGVDFILRLDYYEGAYPHCALYDRNGYARYEMDAVKGRRSLSCVLPRSELNPTRHIRWRVRAESDGRTDLAPNRGWFAH